MNISDLRQNYNKGELTKKMVHKNPFSQFEIWYKNATSSSIKEANAMQIATATKNGLPSLRTVLLKGFSEDGFIFYTNYQSKKGQELLENPNAALLFFWDVLERQIRIEGRVKKLDGIFSTNYFQSRPKGSQIGAWASPQSSVIESREILENRKKELENQYKNEEILPKPDFWGGYLVIPTYFEFWQGRNNRLHDRITYTLVNNTWNIERIAP